MARRRTAAEDAAGTAESPAVDPEIAGMGYEQARDALVEVVRRLESGGATLEESLQLWERGELLAARCEQWLHGAQQRLDAATGAVARGAAPRAAGPDDRSGGPAQGEPDDEDDPGIDDPDED